MPMGTAESVRVQVPVPWLRVPEHICVETPMTNAVTLNAPDGGNSPLSVGPTVTVMVSACSWPKVRLKLDCVRVGSVTAGFTVRGTRPDCEAACEASPL